MLVQLMTCNHPDCNMLISSVVRSKHGGNSYRKVRRYEARAFSVSEKVPIEYDLASKVMAQRPELIKNILEGNPFGLSDEQQIKLICKSDKPEEHLKKLNIQNVVIQVFGTDIPIFKRF